MFLSPWLKLESERKANEVSERVIKCPRLSLLLDRVKAKDVSCWAEGGACAKPSQLVRPFSRVDAYGVGCYE